MQINRISDKGTIAMDTSNMPRIIKNYYKQLHTNQLEDLEEMDRSLDIYYNLPKIES